MRRAGNMPPSIRAPALPQLASCTWATNTGDPAPSSPTASAAVIAELRGEIRTLRNREQAELLRAEMEAHRRSGGDGRRVSRARRGAAQLLARGALEAEDDGAQRGRADALRAMAAGLKGLSAAALGYLRQLALSESACAAFFADLVREGDAATLPQPADRPKRRGGDATGERLPPIRDPGAALVRGIAASPVSPRASAALIASLRGEIRRLRQSVQTASIRADVERRRYGRRGSAAGSSEAITDESVATARAEALRALGAVMTGSCSSCLRQLAPPQICPFLADLLLGKGLAALSSGSEARTARAAAWPGYVCAPGDLREAAAAGDLDKTIALLTAGADPNAPTETDAGWSPLHFAAKGGHTAVAVALLRHGADLFAQDENGDTPLTQARYWGRSDAPPLPSSTSWKSRR